jgi:L-alanine-DL-glutamate epimerase-like enolase superfamily enzyme
LRPLRAAQAATGRQPLTITGIDVHEILPPFHDYNAQALFRYNGLGNQLRTIFVLKTNQGLEGYGESWGPAPAAGTYDKYIGTNPFDWVNDPQNLPINMAAYDLMGKHLGVPAWKLIGQQVRSWVPVAAWTVSQPPEAMAEEVGSVAKRGYRWMKYHVDTMQSIIDQTEAMQKVAPAGFRIHYDFNGDSNLNSTLPVLKELEKFPIAGRLEDPIRGYPPPDYEGYRVLREKISLPILIHHGPVDFMMRKLVDGLMTGHMPIGRVNTVAGLAELNNIPFMLQQAGGTINQAFLAHEATAYKMASLDHVNLCHLWKDDVTVERMPVIGSSVEVPKGPGLGVTLDREKLEKYERAPRPKQTRFLWRMRYKGGRVAYLRYDPDEPGAAGSMAQFSTRYLQNHMPGSGDGYRTRVVTDTWDAVGDAEFERIWKLTESGPVWSDEKGELVR